MERRVLLAIFLSFLVLYTYQSLFVPASKPAPSAAPSPNATDASAAAHKPVPAAVESAAAQAATPTAPPLVGATAERDVRVETDEVIAVFTNRGARLKSWRLKHYRDEKGEPLELVAGDLGSVQPLPFSLRVPDEAATRTLNSGLYEVKSAPADATAARSAPLIFEYRDSAGLQAIKEFQFDPAPYAFTFHASVKIGDRPVVPVVEWGPAVSSTSREASTSARQAGGVIYQNGKLLRIRPADLAKQSVYEGNSGYAGVDDHYFVTMAISPGPSKVSFHPVAILPPSTGSTSESPAAELMSWAIEPASDRPIKFYAGPKDLAHLQAIDPALGKVIDFGRFDFIVVPLLRALNWIHGYVGNYGWSIIILTILINAVMFPLRHKSVVSMRKMQQIQPEAKAIQERYAKLKTTDPARQKMNQELMALYRERGVNPASGCVPMLLTMPVFFAFYAMLTVAIELRGAPFFGWIHDLSRPDPLYIIPVLMGLTQIWQMRITPQTGTDPAQQKMMMIMPVVFMFFFLWTSAGALLYWLVSNVWGIGQQYLTNYLIGPPTVRTVRPPAERRMKRVGSGKTDAASREG
jgi:YidC/Oxa1 family membrane protein insertase